MNLPVFSLTDLPRPPSWARPLALLGLLILAVTLLWRCGQGAHPGPAAHAHPDQASEASLYVCPMHPQVIRTAPGPCPICGMDLVPKSPGPALGTPALGDRTEPALYVCPTHRQVKTATPDRCPLCGQDLVLEGPHDHGDHGDPGQVGLDPAKGAAGGEGAAPLAAVAIQVPGAVIQTLGVRTARVERGDLPRHVEGVGVFLRTALQGYVSLRPGATEGEDLSYDGAGVVLQGQIFERDSLLLRVGQRVSVQVPTLGSQVWEGRVAGFESQVIQTTRTQVFEVWVEPSAAKVAPGLTALLTLDVDPVADVLLVPREAVILTGQGTRVVVALGEGRFEPRAVTVDDFGEERIVVLDGLQEDEEVVVSAQFLLDSEANLQAGLQRLTSQRVPGAQP